MMVIIIIIIIIIIIRTTTTTTTATTTTTTTTTTTIIVIVVIMWWNLELLYNFDFMVDDFIVEFDPSATVDIHIERVFCSFEENRCILINYLYRFLLMSCQMVKNLQLITRFRNGILTSLQIWEDNHHFVTAPN